MSVHNQRRDHAAAANGWAPARVGSDDAVPTGIPSFRIHSSNAFSTSTPISRISIMRLLMLETAAPKALGKPCDAHHEI